MLDFNNATFLKLRKVPDDDFSQLLQPLLCNNEHILCSYRSVRDGVVFTNKRAIAINVQGLTGKKKDFTSMPYSKIQVYSVESAGLFDIDSELELWFSSLGKVRFEFTGQVDIAEICRAISENVL